MSKCVKCGKELVLNIPKEVKMKDGRIVKGMASAPHGCPEEYDHFRFTIDQIGISREMCEEIFDGVQREQNDGTLTQ